MKTRKILSIIITLAMVLSLLPMTVSASAEGGVKYLEYNTGTGNFDELTCTDYTPLADGVTSWNDGWYVAPAEKLELGAVTVTGSVFLILTDGCDLNVSGGIRVNEGNSLTIFAQSDGESMGKLIANSDNFSAGIGGGDQSSGGNVTINGGNITATGGTDAAGIGGGNHGGVGNVTINGGSVTAKSVVQGDGIGSGYLGGGGNVTINGGSVTAQGGPKQVFPLDGVGIGGNITINGGEINAAAGGDTVRAIASDASSLTVNDGVFFTDLLSGMKYQTSGGENWQKVFSGFSVSVTVDVCSNRLAESTVVTNGTTEWTTGWYSAVGTLEIGAVTVQGDVSLILTDGCDLTVGGGIHVTEGNSLTVYSVSAGENMGSLTANGDTFSAGIGSVMELRNSGNIMICGGNVTANGGGDGAGIGGGYRGIGGYVAISGGNVTANGGFNGAGIGGTDGGYLNVSGGYVIAKGGIGAAGIGGHFNSHGINVSVTGGKITAISGGVHENHSSAVAIGHGGNNGDGGRFSGSDDVKLYYTDGSVISPFNNEFLYILGGASQFGEAQTVSFYVRSDKDTFPYLQYNTASKTLETKYASNPVPLYHDFNESITWSAPWYIAEDGVTIDSVTVSGDVNLILKDGCLLNVAEGIHVPEGSSLTVYAQSEGDEAGELIATGTSGSAGIGGAGKVIIHGGFITATGGSGLYEHEGGAGIGGNAYSAAGGDVTIYGGNIKAIGADGGAGIGSGYFELEYEDSDVFGYIIKEKGTAGSIKIYGGNITAQGGYSSAGIGGGYGCDGGSIAICGGTVTAQGGENSGSGAENQASGIGCGWFDKLNEDKSDVFQSYPVEGGAIATHGGTVISNGKEIPNMHYFTSDIYKDNQNGTHSPKCLYCDAYGESEEHIFTSGIYKDNQNGTHSPKCLYCDAYGESEEHIFTSGIYKDNQNGTHSPKCLHCDACGEAEEHILADDACTKCDFAYTDIILEDGTVIHYNGDIFEIDANGILTKYKGAESNVIIPKGVKQIGDSVFYKNITIKEVYIPASVETVGSFAFSESSLTKVNFEKNSHLTTLGLCGFDGAKLISFTVPASVKTIPKFSIGEMSSLTELIFEEGSQLETIGNWAFSADNLTTINIPKTVKSIGLDAFGGMNFTSVYVNWTEASEIVSPTSDFYGSTYSAGTLYVPAGTKDLYANHAIWGKFKNIVEMESDSLTLTVTGSTFTVTPSGGDAGVGIITVALYDSEDLNRLLDVKVFDLTKVQTITGEFTECGYVKAMWWSDFGKMIPLCDPDDGTAE